MSFASASVRRPRIALPLGVGAMIARPHGRVARDHPGRGGARRAGPGLPGLPVQRRTRTSPRWRRGHWVTQPEQGLVQRWPVVGGHVRQDERRRTCLSDPEPEHGDPDLDDRRHRHPGRQAQQVSRGRPVRRQHPVDGLVAQVGTNIPPERRPAGVQVHLQRSDKYTLSPGVRRSSPRAGPMPPRSPRRPMARSGLPTPRTIPHRRPPLMSRSSGRQPPRHHLQAPVEIPAEPVRSRIMTSRRSRT